MVTYFVDKKQLGSSSPVHPAAQVTAGKLVVAVGGGGGAPDTPTTAATANKLIDCHRQVVGANLRANERA